jgi:OOP family OmpA-OmpF porin
MTKATRYLLLFLATPILLHVCKAQDAKGCKDSRLISRFPGSVIVSCVDKADEPFSFTMGSKPPKKIEGEFHRIEYHFPDSATKAEVVHHMNTALRNAGYTFDYDSGDYGDFTVHKGKTWIQIEIGGGGGILETIVVEKHLKQEVVSDASALLSGLSSNGHAVVDGILFDAGKAEVKPESAPALEEIAKLLKQDPKLKLYVVGHTDNVGALAGNIELSQRRASAVVQVLTGKYGVAANRLQAFGNGPYAPLSSNDSEDGRALNRRVELVKQ